VRKKDNLILTGFMGTGKSTVGKRIANRLGWPFLDTDTLIEEDTRMTIPTIFTERGEHYFRAIEQAIISRVCLATGNVIATGGGVMTNEENVRTLKENGTVICLTAQPEVILSRVQGNNYRPLLQGENPLAKIRELLAARAEAYGKADLVVDTSQLSIDEVVDTICSRVRVSWKLSR